MTTDTDIANISTIYIGSGVRERSVKEELARDHPGHFQEYVFGHTIAAFHWEIYEIIMECFNNPQSWANPFMFLAPRDHAKTTILEATFCWHIGTNPLTLTQFIGSKLDNAKKRLKKVASCIKDNKRYNGMYGNLYPDSSEYTWNNEEIEVLRDRSRVWDEGGVERDPTCIALGIETNVEGGRADLQGFDDIVTLANSRSEVTRAYISSKFWMSFAPMLLPDGVQLFAGTRYHFADQYQQFLPIFDTKREYVDDYALGGQSLDGMADEEMQVHLKDLMEGNVGEVLIEGLPND